jgi:HEAT repeat protein
MAIESGEPPLSMDRIITAQTRAAVRAYLDRACTGDVDTLLKALPEFAQLVFEEEGNVIGALAEVLDNGPPLHRIWISGSMLVMASHSPEMLPQALHDKCKRCLATILRGDDPNYCLLACAMLFHSDILDKEILAPLRKMSKSADLATAVAASVALSKSPVAEKDAHDVLVNAMSDPNSSLAAMACVGLLSMGIRHPRSMPEVRRRFASLPPFNKQHVLMTAINLGAEAAAIAPQVEAVLVDKSIEPGTRQIAARALGAISQGSKVLPAALLKALDDKEWSVVLGAVQGVAASKLAAPQAVSKLLARIDSKETEMRRTVAYAFGLLPDQIAAVVPHLIDRLGKETDPEICNLLSMSLVEAGATAVPQLIEVVVRGDIVRTHYAGNILVSIGEKAAEQIVAAIEQSPHSEASRKLLSMFGAMGKNARVAVPLLSRILEQTNDDGIAVYVARAISMIGSNATEAIPSLIRCVAQRAGEGDDVKSWATHALHRMKDRAIPSLRAQLKTLTGEAQVRLQSVLDELEPAAGKSFDLLVGVARYDIVRFMKIAEVMLRKGPISIRGIAREIEKETGTTATGLSANNITRLLGELSAACGGKLTTHGDPIHEKVGRFIAEGQLSELGSAFFDQARNYLPGDKSA